MLAQGRDFSDHSEEFLRNLDLSGIPQDRIQQAYQASLPPDAGVWNLLGNNIEQILKDLVQFRGIHQFFEWLIQAPDIPIEIRDRLRSLERLDLDYLDSYLPQWYDYWDKVKKILPNKPTTELFEHPPAFRMSK